MTPLLSSRSARRAARRLLAAGFFLALGGCATTPQLDELVAHPPSGLPQRVELAQVPFYPQEDYQCGPAALAMALGAAGSAQTPENLAPEVYLPARRGSLSIEMLAAARRNGFVAIEIAPKLGDLLAEVAAGNPVIVLQNLGLSWYPVWHYAVAIGYDLDARTLVLRSGRERRQELPLRTFEYTWARSRRWAMLALPPTRLPATVSERDYVQAVVLLESIGRYAAAETAYRTALQRWPGDPAAWIGVGNAAYEQGDLPAAENAFRRAVERFPRSAAARNNHAQALADLGRYQEALAEARAAVALGGPQQETAERTLRAIFAQTGRGEEEWHR